MKIGKLSKITGVSIRMLRYYESEGLLKPQRDINGYRSYIATDVLTVERIKLLGSAGMTLTTIRKFLPCLRGDSFILEPCDELRKVLNEQIDLTNKKADNLIQSRSVLEKFLAEINQNN